MFVCSTRSFPLPWQSIPDVLERLVHHTKYLTWSNKQLFLRKYCYLTILRTEAKIVSNFFNFELVVHSLDRHLTRCWFQHSFTNKSRSLFNTSTSSFVDQPYQREWMLLLFFLPHCVLTVYTLHLRRSRAKDQWQQRICRISKQRSDQRKLLEERNDYFIEMINTHRCGLLSVASRQLKPMVSMCWTISSFCITIVGAIGSSS